MVLPYNSVPFFKVKQQGDLFFLKKLKITFFSQCSCLNPVNHNPCVSRKRSAEGKSSALSSYQEMHLNILAQKDIDGLASLSFTS